MTTENEPVEVDRVGDIPIYFDGKDKFYAMVESEGSGRGSTITRATLSALKRELNKRAKPIRCFALSYISVYVDREGGEHRDSWEYSPETGHKHLDTVIARCKEPTEAMIADFDERKDRYRTENGNLVYFEDGPYIWDEEAVEELRQIARDEKRRNADIQRRRTDVIARLRKPRKADFVKTGNDDAPTSA